MTEDRGRSEQADGAMQQPPFGAQRPEYWSTRKVYACLGTVTVAAAAIPLVALSRVPVAIPIVRGAIDVVYAGGEHDEHVDWSTLFLPQNVAGSALGLAFSFGLWVPFLIRSWPALKVVGSSFGLGWLCAGVVYALGTNERIGDILSALVTWPLKSLQLGAPALFIALAAATPGIYLGIALERRTVLPCPRLLVTQSREPGPYRKVGSDAKRT